MNQEEIELENLLPPPVPDKDEDTIEMAQALRSRTIAGNSYTVKLNSQRNDQYLFRKFVIVFVMWMLMLVFNMLGSYSCTGDLLMPCNPQFQLQIHTKNVKGENILNKMQKGLEVILYFSKSVTSAEESTGDTLASMVDGYLHLGPSTDDGDQEAPINNHGGLDQRDMSTIFNLMLSGMNWLSGKNNSEVIKTFSERLKFWFNFNGYCRYDTQTNDQFCDSTPGLDVFSSITKDLGLQFAKSSGEKDKQTISRRMVKIYQRMLKTLNESYLKLLHEKQKAAEYDMIEYRQVRSMRNAKRFGGYSSKVLLIAVLALILATIITGHVLLLYCFEIPFFTWFQTHLNMVTRVLVGLLMVFVLLEMSVLSGEIYLYQRLTTLFTRIPIANFRPAFGFLFTFLNIVFGMVQMWLHYLMLRRHIKL